MSEMSTQDHVSGRQGRAESFSGDLEPEEMNTFRECIRESFWSRALPLGVILSGGTAYLQKLGKIRSSYWKIFGAGWLGYILGKVSYASVCRQRILERHPHGVLAWRITGSKGPKPHVMQRNKNEFGELTESVAPVERPTEPLREQYNSMDFNDRPMSSKLRELDDRLRPSLDREVYGVSRSSSPYDPRDTSSSSYYDRKIPSSSSNYGEELGRSSSFDELREQRKMMDNGKQKKSLDELREEVQRRKNLEGKY